ncbi:MAG: DNA-3-methyladenine glycosylase 2 family protein [Deltaproteobacteria bacterium]|nr:DNA-3-methyladenine glycosylase 2 family protein [Deltaproteobacteria bacterium]
MLNGHAGAVRALAKADRDLARLMKRVGRCRLEVAEMQSPFEALAEAIVYQQLTGKAAATIFGRVKAVAGGKRLRPDAVLAATDEALRGAGLSRAKLAALRDLADKTKTGVVPSFAALKRLGDDAIVERLTSIRGVGRWTVEMLLIFRLGRPDVLPTADYGIRKGFARTFGLSDLPAPRDVAARGERWRPHRTVACWYLWRSLEL